MSEQPAADAAPLTGGKDIGVTDQIDIAHRLDAHDPDEDAVRLIPPERDTGRDLAA
jgi:hypothetical protein